MNFLAWVAAVGALLMTLALSSAWLRRLPVSTAAIYLGLGCLIGPWGFGLLTVKLHSASPWFEHITELALILSLFIGGLRLRLPFSHSAWHAARRLASLVMLGTIAGVALFAWLVLDLDPALALLLGAILAPTDPVLAGSVTVGHAQDHDPIRYALSGEAGLNDGAAFPFVLLGLLLLGPPLSPLDIVHWSLETLVWAIPAGLVIGFFLGRIVGRVAIALRSRSRDTAAPTDFLALALIALSYTAAQAVGAFGFLSVFAAGIGLRRAEVSTVERAPHPDASHAAADEHPPAETLVSPNVVTEREMSEPAVAAGVLVAEAFSFGDTVERMLEVFLVVLVGVSLASHWSLQGALLGLLLIFIVRPPVVLCSLIGTPLTSLQRGLVGWFGIRGIGSLYYLEYALNHGLQGKALRDISDLTLSAVATSIVAHGLTSQPLMAWYERRGSRQKTASR